MKISKKQCLNLIFPTVVLIALVAQPACNKKDNNVSGAACMDSNATNYNSTATSSTQCVYPIATHIGSYTVTDIATADGMSPDTTTLVMNVTAMAKGAFVFDTIMTCDVCGTMLLFNLKKSDSTFSGQYASLYTSIGWGGSFKGDSLFYFTGRTDKTGPGTNYSSGHHGWGVRQK